MSAHPGDCRTPGCEVGTNPPCAICVPVLGDYCVDCNGFFPKDVFVETEDGLVCSGCDYKRNQDREPYTAKDQRDDIEWERGSEDQ